MMADVQDEKETKEQQTSEVSTRFRQFLSDTTAHGAAKLTTDSKIRRVVYLVAVLGCSCFLIFTLTQNIIAYYKYDSFFDVTVKQQETVAMPAITICAYNMITYSRIEHFFPEVDLDQVVASFVSTDFTSEEGNVTELLGMSQRVAYELLSPTINGTFLQCKVGRRIIDCSQIITRRLTNRGYCFTVFSREYVHENGEQQSNVATKNGGISFVLDANPDDYFLATDYSAGFALYLHHPDEFPQSGGDIIHAGVGQSVNIAFRKEIRKILSKPYSEKQCISEGDAEQDHELVAGYPYSYSACLRSCQLQAIEILCGCPLENPDDVSSECTMAQFMSCYIKNMSLSIEQNRCHSKCEENCEFIKYSPTITTSSYPNNYAVLLASIHQYPAVLQASTYDWLPTHEEYFMRRRMMELNIYPIAIEHTHVTQQPRYHPFDIFSNIGGLMGLCLGISLVTLVEFLEVAVACVLRLARKKSSTQVEAFVASDDKNSH